MTAGALSAELRNLTSTLGMWAGWLSRPVCGRLHGGLHLRSSTLCCVEGFSSFAEGAYIAHLNTESCVLQEESRLMPVSTACPSRNMRGLEV